MSKSKGKIIGIMGPIVEVEFPKENLPKLHSILQIKNHKTLLEVEEYSSPTTCRCLAFDLTEGSSATPSVKIQAIPLPFLKRQRNCWAGS